MTAGWQRDDPKPIGFKTLREALQTIEEHERMKQRQPPPPIARSWEELQLPSNGNAAGTGVRR